MLNVWAHRSKEPRRERLLVPERGHLDDADENAACIVCQRTAQWDTLRRTGHSPGRATHALWKTTATDARRCAAQAKRKRTAAHEREKQASGGQTTHTRHGGAGRGGCPVETPPGRTRRQRGLTGQPKAYNPCSTAQIACQFESHTQWFRIFPNHRFTELLAELYGVVKTNRHCYMFCDQETMFALKPVVEAAGLRFWKPIVWDKVTTGMGYHYRTRYEFVLFFEKGKRRVEQARKTRRHQQDSIEIKSHNEKRETTERSLAMAHRLHRCRSARDSNGD